MNILEIMLSTGYDGEKPHRNANLRETDFLIKEVLRLEKALAVTETKWREKPTYWVNK